MNAKYPAYRIVTHRDSRVYLLSLSYIPLMVPFPRVYNTYTYIYIRIYTHPRVDHTRGPSPATEAAFREFSHPASHADDGRPLNYQRKSLQGAIYTYYILELYIPFRGARGGPKISRHRNSEFLTLK